MLTSADPPIAPNSGYLPCGRHISRRPSAVGRGRTVVSRPDSCPCVVVLLTERGYARVSTSPARRPHRKAPATTAAVSARSTVGPRPTGWEAGQLVFVPPPFGTDGHHRAVEGGRSARRGEPGRIGRDTGQFGRRGRPGRSPRAATVGGTGRPPRGPPGADGRRPVRPRSPSQRTTDRAVREGTMRSTPSSVSFWTTHSGRSPLTGAKATVTRAPARRLARSDRPPPGRRSSAPTGSGRGRGHQPARHPRPGAVGGHHRLAGAKAADVEQVVADRWRRPAARRGRRRRPWPTASTRRESGAGGRPARPRQLRAERSFEKRPSPAGACPSSSPRASASGPAAPSGGRRGRWACPPATWT